MRIGNAGGIKRTPIFPLGNMGVRNGNYVAINFCKRCYNLSYHPNFVPTVITVITCFGNIGHHVAATAALAAVITDFYSSSYNRYKVFYNIELR